MPSKSKKQRRFMAAAANNPDFAKRAGIPQSVAREYHEADKARMFEGGLAPMNDIMQKGMAGGLERLAPGFKKGGRKQARREAEGYERRPKAVGRKGSKISFGNWGTTRKKGWRAYDPDTRSGRERQRRRKMQRRQDEGWWGEDVLMNVKNPKKRRNLVRAGWQAYTPVESRKGKPGSKRYDYGLTKDTVFYPPQEVGVGGGAPALPRTIIRRDPMSYIGAEGGEVREPVNMFYGGPLRRRMNEMLAEQAAQKKEEDPDYEPWMFYGTGPLQYKDIPGKGGIKKMIHVARMKSLGWVPSESGEGVNIKKVTWYPPGSSITDYEPRDPADIPGAAVPPGREGEGNLVPPPMAGPPPDPRAGRDTEYSRALQQHRQRVARTLGAGNFAEGGTVKGYQEGGQAECTAPTRADNPYPTGSARWKIIERRCGRDPDAPEAAPPPETPPAAQAEEEGGVRGWFGRSQRELEEMGEGEGKARGGYMSPAHYIPASREVGYGPGGYIPASRERGYQMGGPAELRPPMGGVPPRVDMQVGGMMPRGTGALTQMLRRRMMENRQPLRPQFRGMQRPMPIKGGPRMMVPPTPPRRPGMPVKGGPVTMVPPSPPGGEMPGGLTGGPRIPSNMRGMLQRMRMENRPRRGIPGPAGAGGAPNRVGQSDQQGGLARALQRGTGRPPMSRRQGFYR